MQHLDEGTIHSWLDGALSADEAARVQAHFAECRQCAAAVAEARGFIAASSRILTALDNAPRGVIPVAAPVKRVNPMVWRIAATVLVVAAGSLVVVQNRESTQPLKAVSENQTTTLAQPTEQALERGSDAAAAAAADGAPIRAAASQPRSNALTSKVPAVALSEKEGTGTARRGVTIGNTRDLGKGTSVATGQAAGVASDYAATPTAAAPPPPVAPSRAEASVAMDAAAEPARLKIVGSPRQIGAKVTLYEVASGDTVTLTESTPVVLNSVVLRGAASMAPQAAGKTAAAAPREGANVAASAMESRRTSAAAPPAPPVAMPLPTAKVGSAITIHTITWRDPTTGSTLTLSGRVPEAQLQEIKISIDRERAAAAAAAKKNP